MRSCFEEVHIKLTKGFEEINHKIPTQLKLLELTEKETKRLIMRNKRSEREKHLKHVEE